MGGGKYICVQDMYIRVQCADDLHVEARGGCLGSSSVTLHPLRQGLSLNLELTDCLDQWAGQLQELSHFLGTWFVQLLM